VAANRGKRLWRRFALRALVSCGLVALLLGRVHWGALAALLRGVRPAPLLAGWLLIGLCPLLIAARTRLLLGQWDITLRYPVVLALTWLGQFCNTFLPGSTGGDAVKFLRVCRLVPERKAAGLAALVADRLTALVALALLAGGALAFGDHQLVRAIAGGSSARFNGRAWLAMAGLAAAGALVLAFALAWRGFGGRSGKWTVWTARTARVREVFAAWRAGLRPTPALGLALLLALAVHLLAMASCCQFCRALQIPASFGQVLLLWPVTMLAVLLPLTVNGHGLREYVLLFYFQRWHLVSSLAGGSRVIDSVLALSLLMVATDFLWSLPGALCLLSTTAAWAPQPASLPPGRAGTNARAAEAAAGCRPAPAGAFPAPGAARPASKAAPASCIRKACSPGRAPSPASPTG
jgi:uncharacterized membrane protein YbhN (UPF0104 family)